MWRNRLKLGAYFCLFFPAPNHMFFLKYITGWRPSLKTMRFFLFTFPPSNRLFFFFLTWVPGRLLRAPDSRLRPAFLWRLAPRSAPPRCALWSRVGGTHRGACELSAALLAYRLPTRTPGKVEKKGAVNSCHPSSLSCSCSSSTLQVQGALFFFFGSSPLKEPYTSLG